MWWLRSIYWKIHYALVKLHFRKYKNQAPEIVWDRKYKCWLHTSDPFQTGWAGHPNQVLMVVEEAFNVGLCYPFLLDGEESHEHSFDDVLKTAYNCEETFTLDDWMKEYYSNQELRVLNEVLYRSSFDKNLSKKDVEL